VLEGVSDLLFLFDEGADRDERGEENEKVKEKKERDSDACFRGGCMLMDCCPTSLMPMVESLSFLFLGIEDYQSSHRVESSSLLEDDLPRCIHRYRVKIARTFC
jgi:hypothetical protein